MKRKSFLQLQTWFSELAPPTPRRRSRAGLSGAGPARGRAKHQREARRGCPSRRNVRLSVQPPQRPQCRFHHLLPCRQRRFGRECPRRCRPLIPSKVLHESSGHDLSSLRQADVVHQQAGAASQVCSTISHAFVTRVTRTLQSYCFLIRIVCPTISLTECDACVTLIPGLRRQSPQSSRQRRKNSEELRVHHDGE